MVGSTMQPWISRTGADVRQYAPAAERNAGPILDVLGRYLPPTGTMLEIGSGTGQHVIAFAAAHPELFLAAERLRSRSARQYRGVDGGRRF